nr:hypothetical protein KPHV_29780 [Kitasatospora purpeofusca]
MDTRPWSTFTAEQALHEGEEVWHSDPLVSVAGEAYPPRFRVSLTCVATQLEVCVPVCVQQGGFMTADAALGVNPASCLATHGRAINGVVSGRNPPLAIIIARVPDSIRVRPDGTWEWVTAGWGWGFPPLPPERIAELEAEATPEQRLRWEEQRKREVRRLSEVKRRMSEDWRSEVLPQLRDIAELMSLRGLSRAELIKELRKTWSRSQAYEMVNMALEAGVISAEEGAVPPVPLWNRLEPAPAPPISDPVSTAFDIYDSVLPWST